MPLGISDETLPLHYASRRPLRKTLRRSALAALIALSFAYVASYLLLRSWVKPAANMAYFVYRGPDAVDECCYHAFWPLYKIDRFLTGRTHNIDRTPFSPFDMPEDYAG